MKKPKKGEKRKAKESTVALLTEEIKKAKCIGIVALRGVPDRQFQSVRRKLRGKVKFIVAKNSLIKRALHSAGKAVELCQEMNGPTALFLTEMDPFALYSFVKKNKGKAAAKPNQLAPFDIVVPAGETTLPPGPVLSELKAAGIDARIVGGKVVIGKDSVVAKAGSKISPVVAKALQKLGIEPFEVGLKIPAIWEGILYRESVLDIDEKKFFADLSAAYSAAFNLSMKICYPTKENIRALIAKAVCESRAVGIKAKIFEQDIIPFLLAQGIAEASSLESKLAAQASQ
ncbi:MAG: 50S ribosomal protein L10 [Candidatus Micrarchaeia archaeon]